MAKERLLEEELKKMARETRGTLSEVRATSGRATPIALPLSSDDDSTADITDIDRQEQIRRLQKGAKQYRTANRSRNNLQAISDRMTSDFQNQPEELVEQSSSSTGQQDYTFRPVNTLKNFFNRKK